MTVADAAPSVARANCVVADDHPALLFTVRGVVAGLGLGAPQEAMTAPDAVAAVEAQRPRLALLDYTMSGLSGDELIARAHAASPETTILVYTASADAELARRVLELGAAGIVLKESPLSDLRRAIDAVLGGSTYVDPAIDLLFDDPRTGPRLSHREAEVLDHLTRGLSHDQIASHLSLSSNTIRAHVRRAVSHLDARNRTHAVAKAIRLGLLP